MCSSDLGTYRNAQMLFRVTKIFTTQRMIKSTLKNLDSSLAQLSKPPPFTNTSTPSALKKRSNTKINLNASVFSPRRVSFNENSFSAANSSSDSYMGQISPSPHAVSSTKFGKLGSTFKDLEDGRVAYVPLFSPTHRDLVSQISELSANYLVQSLILQFYCATGPHYHIEFGRGPGVVRTDRKSVV